MRTPSDKPARNGGHWHKIGEATPLPAPPPRRQVAKPSVVVCESILAAYEPPAGKVKILADNLGVPEWTLHAVGCGWKSDEQCWTFPMRDAAGKLVGVQRRWPDGTKQAINGHHLGLFMPESDHAGDVLTIVEGCSDLCAALSMGWNFCVARPNCSAILETILQYVQSSKARRVIIVPDADEPGFRGADALQARLKVPSKQFIVPAKDLRKAVAAGLTSQIAESQLKDTLWTMPR